MKTNCLHPGCEGKNWLAGLCGPHHAQAKVWTRVEKTSEGCWLWLGPFNSKGYGRIGNRYAHRISYERAVGPIPTGMMIDHICHVLRCVNPEHLRLVTNKQNEENRAGAQRNSRSGVRGVWWNTRDRLWQVQVKHFGRRYNGGTYRELVDAEAAAVELRNRLHTHNDLDRTA